MSKAGPLQELKVHLTTSVNLLLVGRVRLPDVQGRGPKSLSTDGLETKKRGDPRTPRTHDKRTRDETRRLQGRRPKDRPRRACNPNCTACVRSRQRFTDRELQWAALRPIFGLHRLFSVRARKERRGLPCDPYLGCTDLPVRSKNAALYSRRSGEDPGPFCANGRGPK